MMPSAPTLTARIRAAWNARLQPPPTLLTRRLFLVLLGVVYLSAFASAFVQVEGLIGSNGIMPVGQLLEAATQQLGDERYWRLPTVLWLGASDRALRALCAGGMLLSLLPIAGVATRPALLALWVLYLSLVSVGSIFYGYQWDALLLECGLLALFFAPRGWGPRAAWTAPVSRTGLWLLRWLLARLMFLSGLVKIASGDPSWRDGSALAYHYLTQPIPNLVSYYAYQLPAWLQAASSYATLLIELGAPLLIFGPRRARALAFVLLAGLQLLIACTGNYGFFNLLTLALCVTLLDDRQLASVLPARLRERLRPEALAGSTGSKSASSQLARLRSGAAVTAGVLLALLSAFVTLDRVGASVPRPVWVDSLLYYAGPTRSINAYGLFAVMTTQRPEIVLEGSRDGREWKTYDFHWKPGPLERRPSSAGLHMPRLDWQLWFAALRGCEGAPWFRAFLHQLLQGSPQVSGLLREDPFAGDPPRYLRSRLFRYEFELPSAENGNWWRRHSEGEFCPTVTLRGGKLRRARLGYPLD